MTMLITTIAATTSTRKLHSEFPNKNGPRSPIEAIKKIAGRVFSKTPEKSATQEKSAIFRLTDRGSDRSFSSKAEFERAKKIAITEMNTAYEERAKKTEEIRNYNREAINYNEQIEKYNEKPNIEMKETNNNRPQPPKDIRLYLGEEGTKNNERIEEYNKKVEEYNKEIKEHNNQLEKTGFQKKETLLTKKLPLEYDGSVASTMTFF